jgi:hypothetical protein
MTTPRWGPTEVAWACKSAGVDPSEVLTLLLENQVEAEAATPDAGLRAALLTDEEREELRRLLADARPAPWAWLDSEGSAAEDDYDELQDGNGEMVATGFSDDIRIKGEPSEANGLTTDGRLCAFLRNMAPRLLAATSSPAPLDVERLRHAIRAYLSKLPNANAGLKASPAIWVPSLSEEMAAPLAAEYGSGLPPLDHHGIRMQALTDALHAVHALNGDGYFEPNEPAIEAAENAIIRLRARLASEPTP